MRDQQTNTTESNTACGSELHNSISQTTFKGKNMNASTLPATRFQAGVALYKLSSFISSYLFIRNLTVRELPSWTLFPVVM